MKSILILQDALTEYRRPVIDELARHYRVTVAHADRPGDGLGRYREVVVAQRKAGPFHLQDPLAVARLARDADAVISMFDLRWPAYLLPFVGPRRVRWIVWGHRYGASRLANATRDLLMRRADRILLYGGEEVARMTARGVAPSKIVIAPNTIHVPNHTDTSAEPKRSLLFVGRLQPRKRIDLLLRAFAEAKGDIAGDVELDIVGAGPLDAPLRRLADELDIASQVTFHGAVRDPERLARHFARARAYVSPGPVGLGVLHSFAYGVPVVTLREGRHGPEFQNLRHDHNSLILDGETQLPDTLRWICRHPDAVRVLGRHAYEHYVGCRTVDHMIAGFCQAIEG